MKAIVSKTESRYNEKTVVQEKRWQSAGWHLYISGRTTGNGTGKRKGLVYFMRTYKRTAALAAAVMMAAAAMTGCGRNSGNSGSNGSAAQTQGTQKAEKEETTFAPDLEEKQEDAVINGTKLVGKNERYQMNLPDGTWKIDRQSEEEVVLSSGANTMTIQYLTGNAADDVELFYTTGEFEVYKEEEESLQKYDLTYFNPCMIEGEMDGYVAAVTADSDDASVKAKAFAGFGFPNTSDSYVVYTVQADLHQLDDSTIRSVTKAMESFTALRSISSVVSPDEADSSTSGEVALGNKYADAEGRFELTLPQGEWSADESVEGTVTLTNGAQKITVSVASGESAANVVIPVSYSEWNEKLAPESESGDDEQVCVAFFADAAQEICTYEIEYHDEYAVDVKYTKESRIRRDGTVYTVRAEYTKDAEESALEQGMASVDSFTVLK